MNITILGTGRIGGTLGRKWAAAGHSVVFGSRDPDSENVLELLGACGSGAVSAATGDAIAEGDVVLFAVPWAAVAGIAAEHAAALNGKILIDATNRFFSERPINNLRTLSGAAPAAAIYRAFNALGWEVFADPIVAGQQADLFYTGPERAARLRIEELIEQIGARPVWVGDNDRIELVDSLGELWITLIRNRGWPREHMLKSFRGNQSR